MTLRQRLLGVALLSPLFACGALEPDDVGSAGTPITIVDASYEIRSVHSGRCVAVDGASTESGAPVVQRDCTGTASRTMAVRRVSGDVFELRATHSGQCLSVDGSSTQNGSAIVQRTCSGAASQRWLFVQSGSAVLLKPQTAGVENRRCMDLTGSSKESGAAIIQWTCHGLANQQWTFAKADAEPTPQPAGSVTYGVDATTIFANPERGFYHHQEVRGSAYSPLSQSQLASYRTSEAVSLILRLFYLDAFRSGSISASYLDGMRTDFSRLRAAGLKAVLRFAYTSEMTQPYGDTSASRVFAHIAQLKPVLAANADVIATVQAGFVGAWGEWYYTDYFGDQGDISSAAWADRKSVVDALLDSLPSTRTVQLRTPAFKQRFYGSAALTSSEAFGTSRKARVGHHNDCFLASSDDEGTYGNVSSDKSYLAIENLYVPQGGETCATSSYSGWSNASADLERLHYSYLNRDYLGSVYTSWGSNLDIARRRLGYRLALLQGTFDRGAQPGGELKVALDLRNDGYAAPYNPRAVEIIARHQTTGARLRAKLSSDPRRFVPGATHRIDARLCVPSGTPEGSYALSLSLPDPEPTLHDRAEYAIRLANSGLWDAASGSHDLKWNITVAANQSAPSCSTASVALTAL